VSDISDTVESERFAEIMTMKQRVHETKDEIDRQRPTAGFNRGAAIGLYQRKVRDYIVSVETLLNPSDGDASPYWDEREIGRFSLPGDGDDEVVTGLREFLELPTTFEIEIETERQQSYRHKRETVTETRHARPPERLIEQAFRMTNRALNEAGFDLSEPQDKQESRFKKTDDIEKANEILKFLRALDNDGLREVQHIINNELIDDNGPMTNGHHE
jgi:hypothetical protein